MRLIAFVACASFAVPAVVEAVEMTATKDVAYVADGDPLQKLDVYTTADAKDRPIIVWIHGGGWRKGDKAGLQQKPQALVDRGFVFASVNYRFVPQVTLKEMMQDVAKSMRWLHDHAAEFGGDGKRMIVMGHSAGAHMAALVCTDDRYLKAEGLSLAIVKGCMPVDVGAYDIPLRIAGTPDQVNRNFLEVFGESKEKQLEVSPVSFVAAGKHVPAFLILYCADRPENKIQADRLTEALKGIGVAATIIAAEGKTHGTINSELGLPDDGPTKAMYQFLDEVTTAR